jgi:hypothetical protein
MRLILYASFFISIHSATLSAQISAYYSIPINDGYSSTLTAFEEEFIADDFGPRCVDGNCGWHSGIDLNGPDGGDSDLGYLIRVIESGQIREGIKRKNGVRSFFNAGLKFLIVGDYIYTHLFDDSNLPLLFSNNGTYQVGNCHVMKQNDPFSERWCIVYKVGSSYFAISDFNDDGNSTVTVDGVEIGVQTHVSAGEGIGALGTSGQVTAHLHLGRTSGNMDGEPNEHNPLSQLSYSQPTFDQYLFYLDETQTETSGYMVNYGSKPSPLKIKVRNSQGNQNACRYNQIFDIEKVSFLYSKVQPESFAEFKGREYDSKIVYGGELGAAIYGHNYAQFGNWKRNGIQPKAYNCSGAGDCSPDREDWFYFSDIYWRLSKSHKQGTSVLLAKCPMDAFYDDGDYLVKAKTITIKGEEFAPNPLSVVVDNFQPFIESVEVIIDNQPVYKAGWEFDKNGLQFSANLCATADVGNESLIEVRVRSSEALNNLNGQIVELANGWKTFTNLGGNVWSYTFENDGKLEDGATGHLEFTGLDKNNNQILDMKAMAGGLVENGTMVQIPIRESINLFNPARKGGNIDDVYKFCFENCHMLTSGEDTKLNSSSCFDNFKVSVKSESETSSGTLDGWIVLEIIGGMSPYSISWTDPSGNSIPGTDDKDELFGLANGIYCYEIGDQDCCKLTGCIQLCARITVSAIEVITLPTDCNVDDAEIRFISMSASGGTAPYEFHLEDLLGNWITKDYQTGKYTGLRSGKYFLVATDINLCTGTYEIGITNPSPTDFILNPEIANSCSANGSITVEAYNFNSGYEDDVYDFSWSTDQTDLGQTISTIDNLIPGTYCLTVTSQLTACSIEDCFKVKDFGSIPLQIKVTSQNPCPGASNGEIRITPQAGAGPLDIFWSDSPTKSFWRPNLSSGTYSVTVTDYCNKNISKQVVLEPITTSAQANDCSHPDQNIILNASGGTPPYSYVWDNGAQSSINPNPRIGLNSYTVTDSRSCLISGSIAFKNNLEIISSNLNWVPCSNQAYATFNHANNVVMSTDNGFYNHGKLTYDNLPPGDYTAWGTDYTCSLNNLNFTITNSYFSIQTYPDDICNNINDGTIVFYNISNVAIKNFNCNGQYYSNPPNPLIISDLATGVYVLYFYYGNCPVGLFATVGTKDEDCNEDLPIHIVDACLDQPNGSMEVLAEDCLNYNWSSGHAGVCQITGLVPGKYCVEKINTPLKSCRFVKESPIVSILEYKNISCNGQIPVSPGKITLGGTNFSYLWSNGNTSNSLVTFTPGQYSVTVTDISGCTATKQFSLTCCTNMSNCKYSITSSVTPPSARDAFDAAIDITIAGCPIKIIQWTGPNGFSSSNQNINGLGIGDYTVKVEDGCGRKSSKVIPVRFCGDRQIKFDFKTSDYVCEIWSQMDIWVDNIQGALGKTKFKWNEQNETSYKLHLNNLGTNPSVTVTDESGCSTSATFNLVPFERRLIPNHANCSYYYACNGRKNGPSYSAFKVINTTIFTDPFSGKVKCKGRLICELNSGDPGVDVFGTPKCKPTEILNDPPGYCQITCNCDFPGYENVEQFTHILTQICCDDPSPIIRHVNEDYDFSNDVSIESDKPCLATKICDNSNGIRMEMLIEGPNIALIDDCEFCLEDGLCKIECTCTYENTLYTHTLSQITNEQKCLPFPNKKCPIYLKKDPTKIASICGTGENVVFGEYTNSGFYFELYDSNGIKYYERSFKGGSNFTGNVTAKYFEADESGITIIANLVGASLADSIFINDESEQRVIQFHFDSYGFLLQQTVLFDGKNTDCQTVSKFGANYYLVISGKHNYLDPEDTIQSEIIENYLVKADLNWVVEQGNKIDSQSTTASKFEIINYSGPNIALLEVQEDGPMTLNVTTLNGEMEYLCSSSSHFDQDISNIKVSQDKVIVNLRKNDTLGYAKVFSMSQTSCDLILKTNELWGTNFSVIDYINQGDTLITLIINYIGYIELFGTDLRYSSKHTTLIVTHNALGEIQSINESEGLVYHSNFIDSDTCLGKIAVLGRFLGKNYSIGEHYFSSEDGSVLNNFIIVLGGQSNQQVPILSNEKSKIQVPDIKVYPNPFNQILNIDLISPKENILFLRLLDSYGRQIISKEYNLTYGKNMLQVETSSLLPGIYFIEFYTKDNLMKNYKLIKI